MVFMYIQIRHMMFQKVNSDFAANMHLKQKIMHLNWDALSESKKRQNDANPLLLEKTWHV